MGRRVPARHRAGSPQGGRFAPAAAAQTPTSPGLALEDRARDRCNDLGRCLLRALDALDDGAAPGDIPRVFEDAVRAECGARFEPSRRLWLDLCLALRLAGLGDNDIDKWWADASEIEARMLLADALGLPESTR